MSEETVGKRFLSGDEFLAIPQKKRKWLLKPIIPAKGIVNLYGKPKAGKSLASMGMALAIANGASEWNTFPVETQGAVMILQIDTPEGEMYERIEIVKNDGFDVSNIYFADMSIAPYPFNILSPSHFRWLKHQVELIQPVLIIIDTLREAHEANENDSADMKKVVNNIVSIGNTVGAAIALISHSRKDSIWNQQGGENDIMDEGRGSSYVSGRMDTIMRFTSPKKWVVNMTYKGRSKGADGQVKMTMDEETGMLHLNEHTIKIENAVHKVQSEHPDWTLNKQGKEVSRIYPGIGERQAQRWIKKLSSLRGTQDIREIT